MILNYAYAIKDIIAKDVLGHPILSELRVTRNGEGTVLDAVFFFLDKAGLIALTSTEIVEKAVHYGRNWLENKVKGFRESRDTT